MKDKSKDFKDVRARDIEEDLNLGREVSPQCYAKPLM